MRKKGVEGKKKKKKTRGSQNSTASQAKHKQQEKYKERKSQIPIQTEERSAERDVFKIPNGEENRRAVD